MREWATPFIRVLELHKADIMTYVDHPTNGCVQWRERDPEHPLFHHIFYRRWKVAGGQIYQVQKVAMPETYEKAPRAWYQEMRYADQELEDHLGKAA
jgi:hypothetical protein